MEAPPEKIDAELLEELGSHKTPHCLSVSAVGRYIEHTLPSEERDGREAPKVVPLLPESTRRVKRITIP